jgi:GntR family transcriptional regulator/MocR family aminotransferase
MFMKYNQSNFGGLGLIFLYWLYDMHSYSDIFTAPMFSEVIMNIPLDRQSTIPLYQQIKDYVRQGILSGSLAPETRLPASRQLAQDLGVNRITVENAYSELEAEGLVFSRIGSGTYILPTNPLHPLQKSDREAVWPLWQQNLPVMDAVAKLAAAEDMLKAAGHPNPINFASGISDTRHYPADEFRKVLQSIMRRDGMEAFGYGERSGYAPLREGVVHILASQGLQTRPENILITAGSQQAIALVTQVLLNAGDVILVESPTYSIAIELFRALGFRLVGIQMDHQGMQVDKLEKILQQHHPKLIYTIPNFHNPTGTCLNSARRRQLIVLAERYNIPILEDDFVGDLRYEGRAQPSLKAMDPGGQVIYVSTFSKMLMPGLRVGFLVADGPVYDNLFGFKRLSDLATSTLIQRALEAYVTVGRYQAYLRRSCQVNRKRRDAMVTAIARHLPASVTFDPPQGGLHLWLSLPEGMSSDELLPLACREGVAFAPGSNFFLEGSGEAGWMRLNFVASSVEEIEAGVQRLGKAIRIMQKQV